MNSEFYIRNRDKALKLLEEGSALILFSGSSPVKSGDRLYDFFVNRNFLYVTGIDRENMIFTMVKSKGSENTVLYIPRENKESARWVGENMSKEVALEISGIKDIKYLDEFNDDFSDIFYRLKADKLYVDTDNRFNRGDATISLKFTKEFLKGYPHITIMDGYALFSYLRETKEEYETALIKKAISITKDGIYEIMKNSKAGMYEYELEAYFDYILKKNGVKEPAFNTIAAGGINGTILHYEDNNSIVSDGELVLFDLGASYKGYCGDITRTFPVNGKFTDTQKDFYNMVLEGQSLIINMIRPGVLFKSLNIALRKYYVTELKKRGLVNDDKDLNEFYFHGVSHHLGLETHDVGDRFGELREGMVITVEPGIYIKSLGIGIRIEDDVLVTKNGCEVLSSDIIKTVDEIEEFMKGV